MTITLDALSTDDLILTTGSANTLTVAFATHMSVGAFIALSSASLERTAAVAGSSVVSGFVVSVTISGTNVLVRWTGRVLTTGQTYLLKTSATLSTGVTVVLLTRVRCEA